MAVETKSSTIQKDIIDKEDGVFMHLCSKLRDLTYRRKLFQWVCLPIGMLSQGILESQIGATILDLQLITSTGEQMSSLFIVASSLGYVLGSLVTAYCHGKINCHLMLTVSCVLAGAANIATPYCSTFLLMFIIRCVVGFFLGLILSAVNAEHMHVWDSQGESLLQLIHCLYAVGGIVGPVVASPFIMDVDRESPSTLKHGTSANVIHHNITFNNSVSHFVPCDNFTNNNMTIDTVENLTLECHNHTEEKNPNLPQTTDVHYAFLISGLISVLVAILFLITFLTFNKTSSPVEQRGDFNIPDRKIPMLLKIFLAGLLFLYYFFYCCLELTFGTYLLLFIVKHFDNVSTHEAAYVMSYHWALFATGRVISIFTSKYLPARKLLCIHFSMMAASLSGFIAGAVYYRFDVVTVFACLMGLSFSATFAAGYSWTEAELMKVTGPISATIVISSATASIVGPLVMGHLLEFASEMWFCYFLVVALVMAVFALALLMTFNRCYVDSKYGKLDAVLKHEKPQSTPDTIIQTTHL